MVLSDGHARRLRPFLQDEAHETRAFQSRHRMVERPPAAHRGWFRQGEVVHRQGVVGRARLQFRPMRLSA